MEETKYYNFKDILKWLHFDYEFEKDKPEYPFNWGKENVEFSHGQIIIPKKGIEKMVLNKISDIDEKPIDEINMIYSIPFICNTKSDTSVGAIYQDISLSFRYDKQYKYGDITKSIYEVCYDIVRNATRTNDYYIIESHHVIDFLNKFVINNQWGIGRTIRSWSCSEKMI